jgi:MoaA/NifB/PqqE/SkfB family radical SAM enzyme
MDLPDSPTFCVLPWLHVAIMPNGARKPCCRFRTTVEEKDLHTPIGEALKSPLFARVREQMLKGERVAGCAKCYQTEMSSGTSMRLSANEDFKNFWQSDPRLTYMELGLGNLCNLKCRGCNSENSMRWAKDEIALGYPEDTINDRRFRLSVDEMPDDLGALRRIRFLGGETFMGPDHELFLREILRRADISRVDLDYSTNGTFRVSDEVLAAWQKAKSVSIAFSVDALGRKNDFFRDGSDFDEVTANLKWFRSVLDPSKTHLRIHTVVNIYNVRDLPEIDRWFLHHFPDFTLSKDFLAHPVWLRLNVLPAEEKTRLIDVYEKEIVAKEFPQRILNSYRHVLHLLKTPPESTFQAFVEKEEAINSLRGWSLKAVDPELYHLVERHA